MQIGVTVLALVWSVGELQICMAVATGHHRMPAAKGKSCPRVIETDLVREDFPVRGGVTGDAWNVEVAMRILGRGNRPGRFRSSRR